MQYIYILHGEELTLLARDYLKYLFGKGYKSVRLTNAMEWWEDFLELFKEEESIDDENWLEKVIINTPTCYDSPEKYRRLLEAYMESQQEEEEEDDDNDDCGVEDEDEFKLQPIALDAPLLSAEEALLIGLMSFRGHGARLCSLLSGLLNTYSSL